MKLKFNLLIVLIFQTILTFSQEKTSKASVSDEITHQNSIGASFFMLGNFLEDSPDYYLLTYGYRFNEKNRGFVEFNTWKYAEPLGTYNKSDTFYPGYVRAYGVGFGYQRFHWKGLYNTIQATPFVKQYFDTDKNKIQKGFQLYIQALLGYRFEFFKKRLYLEPAIALKYWPIDTNYPSDFAVIEQGKPKYIFEPSFNFGFKF